MWDDLWTHSPYYDVMAAAVEYYGQQVRVDPKRMYWTVFRHWSGREENWAPRRRPGRNLLAAARTSSQTGLFLASAVEQDRRRMASPALTGESDPPHGEECRVPTPGEGSASGRELSERQPILPAEGGRMGAARDGTRVSGSDPVLHRGARGAHGIHRILSLH
ncbi:MAG TPA: hypothetical protein DGN59_13710 [Candidatus Latescibacteria bacterium]|nr:hypothetical protein [Candidatus Latescibacterota bacterium]